MVMSKMLKHEVGARCKQCSVLGIDNDMIIIGNVECIHGECKQVGIGKHGGEILWIQNGINIARRGNVGNIQMSCSLYPWAVFKLLTTIAIALVKPSGIDKDDIRLCLV